jgi:hypothetical protein
MGQYHIRGVKCGPRILSNSTHLCGYEITSEGESVNKSQMQVKQL